jgi:N-acetylneuraminic acid mutarotase
MKKILSLISAILFFANAQAQKGDSWQQMQSLGMSATHRGGAVSFSIGNKGYLGTGDFYNDFWEYDPTTNVWTQKADFGGTRREQATGFSIGNKGYIGTGGYFDSSYNYSSLNDFWEYDPATNAWTQKANFGGTPRNGATGFSIGNRGYIGIGGYFDSSHNFLYLNDFWEYNPATNAWTKKADFGGMARYQATGFNIASKGYIGTGNSFDDNGYHIYKDFWEYNPATNAWTQKADFGGGERSGATAFSIGSKGYIGTGSYGTDFWEYDPATNAWTQKADFGGSGTSGATGFSIGTKGYIVTGYVQVGYKNNFWEYDPATNAWTQKANFGGTQRIGATSFSIGSKGYIGTGYDFEGYKNDFWEYDPTTNAWTQKADFGGTARADATGFSIGSKGYIGTGETGQIYYQDGTSDFWEYDPITNAWTQKAYFGGEGRYSATGFSIGNKGYIGTGYSWDDNGDYIYNDFWEYNPATDEWIQKADFGGGYREKATGFSIGSKGYIGTGSDLYGSESKNDFWEYDPATNAWTQKANFGGTARYGATAFSIGSKGYIGTGYAGGVYENDFWEYIPTTNAWTQKANFGGTARYGATGFSIDSKSYIGFGSAIDGIKNDWWQYTPCADVIPNPDSAINGPSTVAANQTNVVYKLPYASGFRYDWQVPPGARIVSGQGSHKITVNFGTASGYIKVTICNSCGHSPVGKLQVTVVNSISESTLLLQQVAAPSSSLLVYPNPAKDILKVQINGTGAVTLTDQSGKILLAKIIEHNGVINVAALHTGLYYLKNNATGEVQKVVVTK